jgi:hypothetical protein
MDRMTRRRALLTDDEREILTGEKNVSDNYEYTIRSRIRKKIKEELAEDVKIIAEYDDEILEELQEIVCPDEEGQE